MSTLIDLLRTATPEEIADALMALDAERPGLAYDVGTTLCEKGPSKEFPGPAWGWSPEGRFEADVFITHIHSSRRVDGMKVLRAVTQWGLVEVRDAVNNTEDGPVRVLARVSHHEAEEKSAVLRAAGFEVNIDYGEDTAPKSHTRTLHPYVGLAWA